MEMVSKATAHKGAVRFRTLLAGFALVLACLGMPGLSYAQDETPPVAAETAAPVHDPAQRPRPRR